MDSHFCFKKDDIYHNLHHKPIQSPLSKKEVGERNGNCYYKKQTATSPDDLNTLKAEYTVKPIFFFGSNGTKKCFNRPYRFFIQKIVGPFSGPAGIHQLTIAQYFHVVGKGGLVYFQFR